MKTMAERKTLSVFRTKEKHFFASVRRNIFYPCSKGTEGVHVGRSNEIK